MKDNFGITVGFSTTNFWISKAIRWITRSKVSHAWVGFYDESLGINFVIQAESWGLELRPRKRWEQENSLVAEYTPIGGDLTASLHWLIDCLGNKYDFGSLFWSGIANFFKRYAKSISKKFVWNSPTRLMCSESVIRFLDKGSYASVKDFDPEITSPEQLLIAVNKADKEFKKLDTK